MAKDSKRVPARPGLVIDNAGLDDSVFADTRGRMRELVRDAAAMLRNRKLEMGTGLGSNFPAIDHGTLRILLIALAGRDPSCA